MMSSGHGPLSAALVLAVANLLALPAMAQNFASSGTSWSGSWGFATSVERSVNLQTAQAVRAARTTGPQSVVTSITDNRTNYVDYTAAPGSGFVSDFRVGNDSTNTVGAMNTGDTRVTITGDGNIVTASNGADSVGCQDGSILSSVLGTSSPLVAQADGSFAPSGISASVQLPPSGPGC
jgi:hypothetical protein